MHRNCFSINFAVVTNLHNKQLATGYMKRLIYTILLFSTALSALATSYERLTSRMDDHFNHAEWKEVLSTSTQMVQLRPADVVPYSTALIAAQFLEDIPTENHFLELSQRNRVHIDSLLQQVYVRTRLIHNAQVYEGLLHNLKSNNKWLARVFNIYLLDFYAFARKTDQTIAIADELLEVTPNSNRFKKIKADALFYQGKHEEAIALYEDVLKSDTDNYEIITLLGAYYSTQDCKHLQEIDSLYLQDAQPIDSVYMARKQHIIDNSLPRTIELLQRAYATRPSKHLQSEIARLQAITPTLPIVTQGKRK